MGTAADAIAVARRNVGYTEKPRGSNQTKFAAVAEHPNGAAWCATFLVAVMRTADVSLPSESAYTPTMAAGFKAARRWHLSNPKVGDLVFFDFPGPPHRISHVGIVTAVHGLGDVSTIEGNTDSSGSRTGGQVMAKRRRSSIVGYGRPAYAAPFSTHQSRPARVGPTVDRARARHHRTAVKVIQQRLRITADGDWGPKTQAAVLAFQRRNRLAADAIVGPSTWKALLA